MEIKINSNNNASLLSEKDLAKLKKHFTINFHKKGMGFIIKVNHLFLEEYLNFIEENEKILGNNPTDHFIKLDDKHLYISNRITLLLIGKVFNSFQELHNGYFKYCSKEEKEELIINGEVIETTGLRNCVYGFYLLKFIINI